MQQVDQSDNIKVVVRVRPLFPHEVAKGSTHVVNVQDDFTSLQVRSCIATELPQYAQHAFIESHMQAHIYKCVWTLRTLCGVI